jgi:hypothetical protein
LEQVTQRHTVHELHDQIMEIAGLSKIVHRDDVGVVQSRERAGFAREAFGEPRIAAGLRRQNFKRHITVETRLARPIHSAHASLANQRHDFELRKKRRKTGRCRRNEPIGP